MFMYVFSTQVPIIGNGKVVCLMQRAELVHRVDPMEKLIQFSWSVIEQDRADIIITDIVGTTNQHSWALTSLNSGLFPDISWIKRKLKCGFCLRHSFSTALWFRPSQYSLSMAPLTPQRLHLSLFWTLTSIFLTPSFSAPPLNRQGLIMLAFAPSLEKTRWNGWEWNSGLIRRQQSWHFVGTEDSTD